MEAFGELGYAELEALASAILAVVIQISIEKASTFSLKLPAYREVKLAFG
jgi:hypothetical protein